MHLFFVEHVKFYEKVQQKMINRFVTYSDWN